MKVLFSELDGTTFEKELPADMCAPELHFPTFPSMTSIIANEQNIEDFPQLVKVRRYRPVGLSDGFPTVVFYDRVVDPEEIR